MVMMWRLVATLSFLAASGAAAQPLPEKALEAPTEADFALLRLQWNRMTMAQAYDRVGSRSPAWDAPAQQLLELFAVGFAYSWKPMPLDEVDAATEALNASGCDDPLVLYLMAVGRQMREDAEAAIPLLRRAVEGYKASQYPRCRAWSAPLRLADLLETDDFPDADEPPADDDADLDVWNEIEELRALAVQWVAEASAEPEVADGYQRILYSQISKTLEGDLSYMKQEFCEAIIGNVDADPWLVHMAAGDRALTLAWEARGSGWARDVTEEGWKGFHENMDDARAHFTEAWALCPGYPEAATKMITVAGADKRPDELSHRDWFERAIMAQFDYPEAYSTYFWYLRPRWGGHTNDMYNFGVYCLNTKRYDTMVPFNYYTAVWAIAEENPITDLWTRPDPVRLTRELFEGMLAEPEGKLSHEHLKSLWAAVAWRTGQYEQSRRMIDELGDRIHDDLFYGQFRVPYNAAKAHVYAATGPRAGEVLQADALYEAGDVDAALPLYERLVGEVQDEWAAYHVRDRAAALRIEQAYTAGDWVDMLPDPEFDGWYPMSTLWTVEEDGTLALMPGADYPLLICTARLDGNYEVEAEVGFPAVGADAAAVICLRYRPAPWPTWVSLGVDAEAGTGQLAFNDMGIDATRLGWGWGALPVGLASTLHAELWETNCRATINGEEITTEAKPEFQHQPWITPRFAFTGRNGGAPDAVVRFQHVRIRRLVQPPPGLQ